MTESRDHSWRWAQVMALAVIALSSLPYLCGSARTPPGMRYMGFADHPYDQNSYLSRVQQAREGKFFIRRDFTLEAQRPLFFNPFTWTLGRLAAHLNLTPLAAYQIARVVYAYLLLTGIYWFIGFFVTARRARLFAFALCAFSSGLCWVIPYRAWGALFQRYHMVPICYWIAETIIFESILSFPQFTLTTLFMILSFGFFIRALRGRLLSSSLIGGLCVAAVAFLHTVDVVTVYVVIAAYCAVLLIGSAQGASRALRSALLIFTISLPAMVYQYYLFSTEPVFIEWSKEPFISPHPLSYIIGYGLVLFLAVPAMVRIARSGGRDDWFLFVWVAAVAALLYAPLSFQRRLSLGVHVPLCILATSTVFASVLPRLKGLLGSRYREAVALIIIVLITVPANIVKIANSCHEQRANPLEFYLPTADWEAMSWMRERHNEDAPVLSSYKSGLYLPAYTGNRVYVGHWSETLDFEEKARMAELLLYKPGGEALKESFLKKNGIRYIYFGNFEKIPRPLGPFAGRALPFAMRNAPFLDEIYRRGGVEIYAVRDEE